MEPEPRAHAARIRELLRVLEEADAAHRARLSEEEREAEGFAVYMREGLVPAVHAYVDGTEGPLVRVITGQPPAPGAPWQSRPAEDVDVLHWLEAVTGAEAPAHDMALVTVDASLVMPGGALRLPESDWTEEEERDAEAVQLEPSPATLELVAGTPAATVTAAPLSESARALQRHPRNTVAMERTLARAPLFAASTVRHGLQLELGLWRTTGTLYSRPFRVMEPRGPLTVRDALGLSHLIRRWADMGYPEDRRVRASENEAVAWFGYSTTGGRQRELLREAMGRLRATTFQSASRPEGGRSEYLTWGLIDLARTPRSGPEGRVGVTLSEPLAYLVRAGSVAYLDAPTFAALVDADELAARLWVFLEAEDVPWRWSLYSAPENEPEAERDTPAIADLLRISGWERRRDVARRVAQAASVIESLDARYRLTVSRAPKGRGMWTLNAGARVGTAGRARGVLRDAQGSGDEVLRDARSGTAGRARGVLRDARSRSESGGTVVSLPSVSTNGLAPRIPRGARPAKAGAPQGSWPAPSWDTGGVFMAAWRECYPKPPTEGQLDRVAALVTVDGHDVASVARELREAPRGRDASGKRLDALAHVFAIARRGRAEGRREEAESRRAAGQRSGAVRVEPIGAIVQRAVTPQARPAPIAEPAPQASPSPSAPRPEPAPVDADTFARRRVEAVAFLRLGIPRDAASGLMERYGITEEELRRG